MATGMRYIHGLSGYTNRIHGYSQGYMGIPLDLMGVATDTMGIPTGSSNGVVSGPAGNLARILSNLKHSFEASLHDKLALTLSNPAAPVEFGTAHLLCRC